MGPLGDDTLKLLRIFEQCLVRQRIQSLRQSAELLKQLTHLLRRGGFGFLRSFLVLSRIMEKCAKSMLQLLVMSALFAHGIQDYRKFGFLGRWLIVLLRIQRNAWFDSGDKLCVSLRSL